MMRNLKDGAFHRCMTGQKAFLRIDADIAGKKHAEFAQYQAEHDGFIIEIAVLFL